MRHAPDTDRMLNGHRKKWSNGMAGSPIVFCTCEVIEQCVKDKSCIALVWPDEGDFDEHDRFIFNEKHGPPHYDVYEPLLLDMMTAQALVLARGAITKDETREKFDLWIAKSRAHFGKLLDIAWGHIK